MLSNISDKWPFKDFTERRVTIKDGIREKWANNNSPPLLTMHWNQLIFKLLKTSLIFCGQKLILTNQDGSLMKCTFCSWNIILEVKILFSKKTLNLMNGMNGFWLWKVWDQWTTLLDLFSINWERFSCCMILTKI